MNFEYTAEVPLVKLSVRQGKEWINYPLGVFDQFAKRNTALQGMDLLYAGDIPERAGLSSSASIEMVTACAINDMYGAGLSMLDLIHLSRRAENDFVGVNCGIMDQFAVGSGKKDHAIFLDCSTLDYELVPLHLGDYQIVIANTNKKRSLSDSKYNERVDECNRALTLLNQKVNVRNLSEVDMDQFNELIMLLTDPVILKRARHIITENQRVRDSVKALKMGNLAFFGKLMDRSHDSLRNDYEVTGMELDTMVGEARSIEGVLGSRMTGAGFGGCTVSLVHHDKVDLFMNQLGNSYTKKTGINPSFYVAEIGDGAQRMHL
jgi:galactokinase